MSNSDTNQELLPPLSPGQLAWKRLKRNKLAMAGLFLVVLAHILCFLAPLFTSQSPSRLRPWVGSLAPGSESIACHEENVLRVGDQPAFNEDAIYAEEISITCSELVETEYRITAYRSGRRKGTIKQIQEKIGANNLRELNLESGEIIDVDNPKRSIGPCSLKIKDAAPPGLFADGNFVVQLKHRDPNKTKNYTVNALLKNGQFTSISKNDGSIDEIRIYGEHIDTLLFDGQTAMHYHLLGTDPEGRDLWSRILYGGRISLMVGIVATIVSLIIGVFYGAISGFQGGRTDRVMMSTVDVLYAIPFMFIVILLLVAFGRNIIILFMALGAVQWLTTARIVRGQVLTLKSREFIEAAKVNGASTWTIITRHLLPNSLGPIIVYATLTVPAVILEESFLAFLGLQVEWGSQPLDSWGYLVDAGRQAMDYQTWDQWWLLVWPALAMILTLFGLNTLGDGLRDALDPQDHGHD